MDSDDRFARGVAVETGYVPKSMLVAPLDPFGSGTLGVVGVYDPGQATAPDLDVPLLMIAAEHLAQRVQSASAAASLDVWLHRAHDTVFA